MRFNFDDCKAQNIEPFCIDDDDFTSGCALITDSSFDATTSNTNLIRTFSTVYFKDLDQAPYTGATCASSCIVYLEQEVGTTWVPIVSQFVASCASSESSGLGACNVSASPTSAPTQSLSGTPLPTNSVNATPYPTASPSSTSTRTGSTSVSPSTSASNLGSRSAGAEAGSQTASPSPTPAAGAAASPSPSLSKTASVSVGSGGDDDACSFFEIKCRCDYDDQGSPNECLSSVATLL